MANYELSSKVAHLRHVSNKFVDYLGNEADVAFENIELILRAMGYNLDDDEALSVQATQLDTHQWLTLLEPITVLSPLRDSWGVNLYITSQDLMTPSNWQISFEDGSTLESVVHLDMLTQTGDYWMGETQYVRRLLTLPPDLPLGYHQIKVVVGDRVETRPLIVTPKTSFQSEPMARGDKIWGTAIQLYTLRSDSNWGMGDFTDLAQLIEDLAAQGADVIGLNPIHALYPISPDHNSPYSPSNRSFLNSLYADVTKVPEFKHSKALQKKVCSKVFNERLKQLRAVEDVDYQGVSAAKHECFELLYQAYLKEHHGTGSAREQAFNAFVEQQGEPLVQHALFEALLAHFKALDINAWGWPVWPDAYKDHRSAEVKAFKKENQEAIRYWQYLQFITDEQLQAVDALAKQLGMKIGIYRDLAVGADKGGAEIWSNKESFCLDASVGAPPDALGPNGQNWGLPPLDPVKLKDNAYSTFITLLRNNMRACGALRIDHAMSLLRLWWCPPGKTAAYGTYVYYDMFDMLGILNLESQRNQCLVIAEDLGTVPDEVTEFFPKAELYSNKVFYFEIAEQGCTEPADYASKALAIVCNHDMPTLKAFWNKSDLALRWELGMFGSEQDYTAEQVTRDTNKQHILTLLKRYNRLPSTVSSEVEQVPEMTEALCMAIHAQLAEVNSQIVAVQLEDLMLINKPVNIPGTSSEYPNWRRKLSKSTEALFKQPEIVQFCKSLNKIRAN